MTTKELKIQLALGLLDENDLIKMVKPMSPWDTPGISKELLAYLSSHKNNLIRYWVARNPNTPINILKILSKDENWYVCCNAKCNPASS